MKTRTLIGLLGAGLVLAGSPDYSYGQRSPGSIYLDQAMKDVPPNARVGFQLQQSAMDGAYQQRLMREELEEDHQRQKAEQRRAEQQRAEQNRRQQFFAEQRRRQQDQDLEVYAMNRWIDINHDGVFDPGEDQGRKDFYAGIRLW